MNVCPCIPKEWNDYYIRYEYGTSVYNINVRNLSHNEISEVKSFKLNGQEILEKQVKLIDNGRIYEIDVEL